MYNFAIDMLLDVLYPCKENVLSFCALSSFCLPYAHFFVSGDVPVSFFFTYFVQRQIIILVNLFVAFSCIANTLLLDRMSLFSVIIVLCMPLRKNICYFPLMSRISSSHFLSIILHHSDVVVSDALSWFRLGQS